MTTKCTFSFASSVRFSHAKNRRYTYIHSNTLSHTHTHTSAQTDSQTDTLKLWRSVTAAALSRFLILLSLFFVFLCARDFVVSDAAVSPHLSLPLSSA